MRAMIEVGAAGVQGRISLPRPRSAATWAARCRAHAQFIQKLVAARLAADVMGVPTLLVARTDATSAQLHHQRRGIPWTSPLSPAAIAHPRASITSRAVSRHAIARGLGYAPCSPIHLVRNLQPDVGEAREFAQGVTSSSPARCWFANCSPSFNWRRNLDEKTTPPSRNSLARWFTKPSSSRWRLHSLNSSMFEPACHKAKAYWLPACASRGREFAMEKELASWPSSQTFVGVGYFDEIQLTV